MKCVNDPIELRVLHCWHHRESVPIGPCPRFNDGAGCCNSDCYWGVHFGPTGTCMLARGHIGPHEFMDDSDIGVSFGQAAS